MFSRRAFNPSSFSPNSFVFEIIDDGEEDQSSGWGVGLAAAHMMEYEYAAFSAKRAKRRKEEFAMMVLM